MNFIHGCKTTKIYCRPGCPPGRRTKLQNRILFTSIPAAMAAGYRTCKVCRPDTLSGGPWRSRVDSQPK